jgi:hypothetical protein
VAANALYQYPRYRSQQDRFWDRPMPVHVAALIRQALEEGALGRSELRRKLPAYAQGPAEGVLDEQQRQGLLHRHPPANPRSGERFGLRPPDPKDYLRPELSALFGRLSGLGFTAVQLRASALEVLHDEEWSPTPPPQKPAARPARAEAASEAPEPTAQAPVAEANPPAAHAPSSPATEQP